MKNDWYEVEVKLWATIPTCYGPDPEERRFNTPEAALKRCGQLRRYYGDPPVATRIIHVQRKVVNKRKIKEAGDDNR